MHCLLLTPSGGHVEGSRLGGACRQGPYTRVLGERAPLLDEALAKTWFPGSPREETESGPLTLTFMRRLNKEPASAQLQCLTGLLNNRRVEAFETYTYR